MSYHTILIGTSKTEEGKEYYCKGNNKTRFWGTLASVNHEFDPETPNIDLLNEKHVLVTDISKADPGTEKGDKDIKIGSLQCGFYCLRETLKQETDLRRIGFNGKQAAKWSTIYFLDELFPPNNSMSVKDDLFSKYGKQNWKLKFNNSPIDCHILTNTNRQWKRYIWLNFWKEVFNSGFNK